MTDRQPRNWSKYLVIGFALACVAAFVYWVVPHRKTNIVTTDGQHEWREEVAPVRYDYVWRPPERVELSIPGRVSLIRPHFSDNGRTLYFTLRGDDGEADIYRARRVDDAWHDVEPVEELNSPADDIGPVISVDGRQLYMYSDRSGGEGGFDLYVSDRTTDGWSTPRNLGPRINTLANEYAPAISPDGESLYFSSNRNRRMQQRTQGDLDDAPEWTATLRAQQPQVQYDLYAARRDDSDEKWPAAEPVAELNQENSNEGTPFVSASGTFLYFASDRQARGGEKVNYDLFRARIDGTRLKAVENLGPGVNTAGNELDPALALDGFHLLFSSDRTKDGDQSDSAEPDEQHLYALYSTTGTEVFEETTWTESKLSVLSEHWWWIVLVLLVAALLAALAWYLRQVSLKRAPLPGFLLIALVVHLLLAGGMFFVGIGGDFIAKVQELADSATPDFGNDVEQEEPKQAAYEKVADLESMKNVEPADVERVATTQPTVTVPAELNIPSVPNTDVRNIPIEQIVLQPPEVEPTTPDQPQLGRRRLTAMDQLTPDESIELAETAPAQEVNEPDHQQVNVSAPKGDLEMTGAPKLVQAPRTSLNQTKVEDAVIEPAAFESKPRPKTTAGSSPLRRLPRGLQPGLESVPINQTAVNDTSGTTGEPNLVAPNSANELAQRTGQGETPVPPLPARTGDSSLASAAPISGSFDLKTPSLPANTPTTPVRFNSGRTAQPAKRFELTEDSKIATLTTGQAESPQQGVNPPSGVNVEVPRGRESSGSTEDLAASAPSITGIGSPRAATQGSETAESLAEVVPRSQGRGPALKRIAARVLSNEGELVTIGDAASLASADTGKTLQTPGVDVGVERPEGQLPAGPAKTLRAVGGTFDSEATRLQIGKLGSESLDAAPSFGPSVSQLVRRSGRAATTLYAGENIGLSGLLASRQGNMKKELFEELGGNDEALEAVKRGQHWLAAHQFEDGHWSLNEFDKCCRGHAKCKGHGSTKSDVAATGFALLSFLGSGQTHRSGERQATIQRGLDWLVKQQDESGELTRSSDGNARMYSHAIGTIALCEAYSMTGDLALLEPAQLAVDFIVQAQDKQRGGWRYQPGQPDSDTSVVGWQVMALKSGEIAGLTVPQESFTLVGKWLNHVAASGPNRGQFGYVNKTPNNAMTAEALLCRRFLGARHDNPELLAGANHLLKHMPKEGKDNSYYWYYATQLMFHLSPDYWKQWNAVQRDLLTKTQIKDGPMRGTWDPKDQWEGPGGRIYATAMRVMMLEVYYRYQPLYKVLNE